MPQCIVANTNGRLCYYSVAASEFDARVAARCKCDVEDLGQIVSRSGKIMVHHALYGDEHRYVRNKLACRMTGLVIYGTVVFTAVVGGVLDTGDMDRSQMQATPYGRGKVRF